MALPCENIEDPKERIACERKAMEGKMFRAKDYETRLKAMYQEHLSEKGGVTYGPRIDRTKGEILGDLIKDDLYKEGE